MLIALSKYLKPMEEIEIHRPAHHAFLRKYFAEEKLLICGRQNPSTGGVLIAKITCLKEFKQIIANDPFVLAGVSEYTITEMVPFLYDPAMEFFVKPNP